MSVEYPGAIDMMLPLSYSFSSVAPLSIVEHQTGGDLTLDAVHQTFLATMRSTHFAVDRDGNVAQFVSITRGAGGNCCPDRDSNGNLLCDPYWLGYVQQYGNLNFCTISIEHCNDSNNALPMTQAQVDASNKLNLWLCQRFTITTNHIKGHNSIDPVSKPDCPGATFDFNQLFVYIQQGGINPHMEQQMQDVWDMFLAGINQPLVPYTTGIATSWKQQYQQINAGSPLGPEKQSVDWQGNSIQIQYFSGGLRCEWSNATSTPAWYDAFNRRVA